MALINASEVNMEWQEGMPRYYFKVDDGIPVLVVTEQYGAYGDKIRAARAVGFRKEIDRAARAKDQLNRQDKNEAPSIYEVELNEAGDVFRTGGPLGTHELEEFANRVSPALPSKLEEYSDEQIEVLKELFLVPKEELVEIRRLEKDLANDKKNYREIK